MTYYKLFLYCVTIFINVYADNTSNVHTCPLLETNDKTIVLKNIINILNDLEAPYNLHTGTLLHFMRNCNINDTDIDIAISLDWWKRNDKLLEKNMRKHGFHHAWSSGAFGSLEADFGYELAWEKNNVRVDLFSKVDYPSYYIWELWIHNKVYKCFGYRQSIVKTTWGNLTVKIPFPVKPTLKAWYGKDYMKPFPGKWIWNVHPFTVGTCTNISV